MPCGKRGGIHVNSYLDTANSPVMYIGVIALLVIVLWQAAVYIRKAGERAKELNIPKEKLKKAAKVACLTSIVPSIAIIVAFITLAPVLGIPVSWGRLSIIGSLSYELMAANIGATSSGVTLGGPGYDGSAFLTSVIVMTVGSFAMLGMTIFGFKPYKNRLNRSLSKEGAKETNPWSRILMAALIVSLYCRFIAEPVAQGGMALVTMVISALLMIVFTFIIKKIPKLRWLNDFTLSICMILAMAAAVILS